MKGNIFADICLFQAFAYDPAQSFHAVTSVRLFAVKQPDMRVFRLNVFSQSFGYVIRQWHNPVFLVFALPDMNSLTLKINIGEFQVNGLLRTQSCRIDQSQHDAVLQKGWCLKPVSYTHLRAHETDSYLVCRLLL